MRVSPLEVPARAEPTPREARAAVSTVFFVNGFVFASWVPHIPTVQSRLGLSTSLLGLGLLGVAAGALVAMPVTGALVSRWGSRFVTLVSALLLCALVVLPVRALDFPSLVLALVALGAANGSMDVAMNAHAVAVERRVGRTIMSSFHGLFSLGGLAGAGGSVLLLSRGMTPETHMLGVAAFGGTALLACARFLLPASADGTGAAHAFALPRGPLLVLGAAAFVVMMVEGAMADWSAVYLRQSLAADAGLAGAGYAGFSLAMALGRLTGDRFVSGVGPRVLLGAGALLAAGGLGAALLLHHPVAAVVGFGCVGLGLSNLVPVLFSAAGRMSAIPAAVGIAAVSTTGYGGFLVGPPLVGLLADWTRLPVALGLLVVFLGLIAAGARRVFPAA